MKILILTALLFSSAMAQRVERLVLTTYSGNGITPETAFAPTVMSKYGLDYEDITSVERADSVNLVIVRAEFDASMLATLNADTSCIILDRNSTNNNRGAFNTFLARKKNGIRLRDAIAGKPAVNVDDIILELRRIDREKKP
jgi:hypothetical protein